MATYSDVDCCEIHNSVSEQFGESRTATVQLKCAWSDRYALVADLIDNGRTWPHGPDGAKLRAKSASVVPEPTQYNEDGQAINYLHNALVTVNYDDKVEQVTDEDDEYDPAYEPDESTSEESQPPITDLMSESFEPAAEFITLDHKGFRWGAADGHPLLEGESPGRLLVEATLVRTLFKVETIPASVLTNLGKVNGGTYRSRLLGVTFEKETLLYLPPTMNRTIKSDGTAAWNLTLRMTYKPDTWNKFWRAKTGAWEKIFVAGGGEYVSYPIGSFAGLLF